MVVEVRSYLKGIKFRGYLILRNLSNGSKFLKFPCGYVEKVSKCIFVYSLFFNFIFVKPSPLQSIASFVTPLMTAM